MGVSSEKENNIEGNRIAVVFPGIGYHSDKPLLYFAKKLARENGYTVVEVTYEFPQKAGEVKGNAKKMKDTFELAVEQAGEQLSSLDLKSYEDVLFIEKSIGTTVGAFYDKQNGIGARHIVFTPVAQSFNYIIGNNAPAAEGGSPKTGKSATSILRSIVFHGSADPWCETKLAADKCRELALPLYITEDGNHSLETGVALTDIANLKTVMEKVADFIKGN